MKVILVQFSHIEAVVMGITLMSPTARLRESSRHTSPADTSIRPANIGKLRVYMMAIKPAAGNRATGLDSVSIAHHQNKGSVKPLLLVVQQKFARVQSNPQHVFKSFSLGLVAVGSAEHHAGRPHLRRGGLARKRRHVNLFHPLTI